MIPQVSFTHTENNLGLPASSAESVLAIVGASSLGTANVLHTFDGASPGEVVSTLGYGPLSTMVAGIMLTQNHGTVVAIPGTKTAGSWSTVVEVGSAAPDLTLGGTVNDSYRLWVKCVLGGTESAAKVIWSLDDGANWSEPTGVASAITLTGSDATATFATGTFTTSHEWKATSVAPKLSDANIGLALDALISSGIDFGHVHVITSYSGADEATNATAFAATFAAVAVKIAALESAVDSKPVLCTLSAPMPVANDTSGLTAWKASLSGSTYAALQNSRFEAIVTPGIVQSPILPIQMRMDAGSYCAVRRLSSCPISEDLGRVQSGSFSDVLSIEYNAAADSSLDSARIVTLMKRNGAIYITNGHMMSAPGSDIKYVQHRRVVDAAERVARTAYTKFIGESFDANTQTGKIAEYEALAIDESVNKMLNEQVGKHVSGVEARLSRNSNIMTTFTSEAELAIVPKLYLKKIIVKIGLAKTLGAR